MATYNYAISLEPDDNDTFLIICRDLPTLVSFTEDRDDAAFYAQDAIKVILSGMMEDGHDIPVATPPEEGEIVVPMPSLTQQKVALYTAMRAKGWTIAELGRRLGLDYKSAYRLVDAAHNSRHDQIDRALWALGYQTQISLDTAAVAPSIVATWQKDKRAHM